MSSPNGAHSESGGAGNAAPSDQAEAPKSPAPRLKTSFNAAAGTESACFIKDCDCQGDDGDDVAYDL